MWVYDSVFDKERIIAFMLHEVDPTVTSHPPECLKHDEFTLRQEGFCLLTSTEYATLEEAKKALWYQRHLFDKGLD